jgi:hypothetical protein
MEETLHKDVNSRSNNSLELLYHRRILKAMACARKYAIIDVTEEAGQIMEIERTRDYCTSTTSGMGFS